ncbi:uncharacterized protein LOC123205026 [Mangifera indica]|uniref:uncharacterized protein LOC123205026 n=1 Tax=Mangifera indica TaxID=29780 RepID=UPI001CFB55D4|nr:uncharacterized protein LOC123205026 [Mangifera indica]
MSFLNMGRQRSVCWAHLKARPKDKREISLKGSVKVRVLERLQGKSSEMAKYNVVQKRKRGEKAQRKRAKYGDSKTGKLKNKLQTLSVSGKRQRKLLIKWRREQKEALESGLVSMQDVEMAAAEGTLEEANKTPTKFHMKKGLKLKHLKGKCKKGKSTSKPAAAEGSVDSMVE